MHTILFKVKTALFFSFSVVWLFYVPLCVGGSGGGAGMRMQIWYVRGGGMLIICTLENDATLYIDTTGPLLIVGLNLLII